MILQILVLFSSDQFPRSICCYYYGGGYPCVAFHSKTNFIMWTANYKRKLRLVFVMCGRQDGPKCRTRTRNVNLKQQLYSLRKILHKVTLQKTNQNPAWKLESLENKAHRTKNDRNQKHSETYSTWDGTMQQRTEDNTGLKHTRE